MQIYKALNTEILHNKEFRMGSIILQLDNKMILVCNKFNHSRKYNLELTIWLPTENKWVRTYAKNEYTEMMWNYYRKHQQKRNHDFRKYENMMKHERRHKGGGGGSRIYNGSMYIFASTTFRNYGMDTKRRVWKTKTKRSKCWNCLNRATNSRTWGKEKEATR